MALGNARSTKLSSPPTKSPGATSMLVVAPSQWRYLATGPYRWPSLSAVTLKAAPSAELAPTFRRYPAPIDEGGSLVGGAGLVVEANRSGKLQYREAGAPGLRSPSESRSARPRIQEPSA